MKIRDRLEACLAKIDDPTGEGKRAFTRLYTEQARALADAQDRLQAAGAPLGPLGGYDRGSPSARSRRCNATVPGAAARSPSPT